MDKDEFLKILKSKKSAPFLFLGSGFTKHYLGTPKWDELLQHFSSKPLGQYSSTLGTDNLYVIASALARDINEDFWNKIQNYPDCEEQRYVSSVKSQDDYIKAIISRYLLEFTIHGIPEQYKEELNFLSSINIDGIITTNWDDLAELVFQKFKSFVGQEDLLFSDVQNIGEIYKIHGSILDSKSLVLTKEDYDDYNSKNAYLAAKLITIFVEHPVVFMGYSLNDPNIQHLLETMMHSIGKNSKGLERLRNNLIFVDWQNAPMQDIKIEYMDKHMSDNKILPCIVIKTHDFMPVYDLLSHYERTILAHLLRLYKKNFYTIVRSEKPEKKIYALSEAEFDKSNDIQFVCGFGAIEKYKEVGYKSIDRSSLFKDIVEEKDFNADLILKQTIPSLFNGKNNYLPCFKYLNRMGISNKEDCEALYPQIFKELKDGAALQSYPHFTDGDKKLSFEEVLEKYESVCLWKVFALIPYISIKDHDIEKIDALIKKYIDQSVKFHNNSLTHFRKLVCYYDWCKYGQWFHKSND